MPKSRGGEAIVWSTGMRRIRLSQRAAVLVRGFGANTKCQRSARDFARSHSAARRFATSAGENFPAEAYTLTISGGFVESMSLAAGKSRGARRHHDHGHARVRAEARRLAPGISFRRGTAAPRAWIRTARGAWRERTLVRERLARQPSIVSGSPQPVLRARGGWHSRSPPRAPCAAARVIVSCFWLPCGSLWCWRCPKRCPAIACSGIRCTMYSTLAEIHDFRAFGALIHLAQVPSDHHHRHFFPLGVLFAIAVHDLHARKLAELLTRGGFQIR